MIYDPAEFDQTVEVDEATPVPEAVYLMVSYNTFHMCTKQAMLACQEHGVDEAMKTHRGQIARVQHEFSSDEDDVDEDGSRFYLRDIAAVHAAFYKLIKQAYIRDIFKADRRQMIIFSFPRMVNYDELRILHGAMIKTKHGFNPDKFAFGLFEE